MPSHIQSIHVIQKSLQKQAEKKVEDKYMPFFDDFLNFTNSFSSDDPSSLDPYANGEDNLFFPSARRNATDDYDDDEEDDYEQ